VSQRVTDEMVAGFLRWGRNYGEVESFEKIAESGRKWKITLASPSTAAGPLHWLFTGVNGERTVPQELVLTSREALVFGYGLATAGTWAQSRREFAMQEWGWENDNWPVFERASASPPQAASSTGPESRDRSDRGDAA
jgi:hypothetical protein